MEPPSIWPKEVTSKYEAVKFLGKGGFASVILAKKRGEQKDDSNNDTSQQQYVAMKAVAARTDAELSYAHREMNILLELSHSNIMKLLQHWETSSRPAIIMALSYHPGITLETIISKKGAPTLNFCRIVLAQLVDAISYLHSRAVLHRDIKPDNIIIENCTLDQTEIWDDSEETQQILEGDTATTHWNKLHLKYHVVLIDFGFARALTKREVETSERNIEQFKEDNPSTKKNGISRLSSFASRRSSNDGDNDDDTDNNNNNASIQSSLINHKLMRKLSAVGNRRYSAPEIIHGVYEDDTSIRTRKKKKSNTISEYVSDYSMVVDAFSLGATMRQVLSGVSPEQSIDDAIFMQNVNKILCCCSNSDEMKKIIRSEFPKDASTLVHGLIHGNPQKRMTVANARLHPYINDVLPLSTTNDYKDEQKQRQQSTKIQYLRCASHINDALED